MATTFVSAFLDLHEDRSKERSVVIRLAHFQHLVQTGISLVLFVSPVYLPLLERLRCETLRIIPIELEELETYKAIESIEGLSLPRERTEHHDTRNFMILINSKIEFVMKVMKENPYHTSQFAWIDSGIFHIMKSIPSTKNYLQMLGQSLLRPGLWIPGCWAKGMGQAYLYNAVNWRFCGGFFIGNTESLQTFYDLYQSFFSTLLRKVHTLVWEVNTWALLELEYGWTPCWYAGSHDDSILRLPAEAFQIVAALTSIPSRFETSCRTTIDSLLGQVDRIYLSIPWLYERFQSRPDVPAYLQEEPYCSRVQVVRGEDAGSATKYLGPLSEIPAHTWIFFCDDDQVYHPTLLSRMMKSVSSYTVYQNRVKYIRQWSSGGLIHGFVGNLVNRSLLEALPLFSLPSCARHIDDQWMSVYYAMQGLQPLGTEIDEYGDIYATLDNHHELMGADSLAQIGNRATLISQLSKHFSVIFTGGGEIRRMDHIEYLKVYHCDSKFRLGAKGDNGYVIADLSGYDCYISAGVGDDESFTRDFLKHYPIDLGDTYAFDGTIAAYPYTYTTEVQFVRKNIAGSNTSTTTDLKYLIRRYKNIFLKIDIEGGEYDWLASLTSDDLLHFKQIAIEVHCINDDGWNVPYAKKLAGLRLLAQTHWIVHAHTNNNGTGWGHHLETNGIPTILELTYIRKDCFPGVPPLNTVPLPIEGLDFKNTDFLPDLALHSPPFTFPSA